MLIVGIGGGTASGKTTLACRMAGELGPRGLLLAHDRYYKTLPEAYRDRVLDYNFDHPDALDSERLADDIKALKSGKSIQVPDYDFTNNRRMGEDGWEEMHPEGVEIVLVEGILVLAVQALREQFDRCFFVHTPADVRLARRLRRDIVERGDTVEGVLDQYLATVRPMHEAFVEPSRLHAERVFDGMADLDATVRALVHELH